MLNLKNILILLFFACVVQVNAQSNELEITTNRARVLFSGMKEKINSPICVVNGIIFDDASKILSVIKPEDVKNIEVLKNEPEIKKYGSKGKNGVLLITLKNSTKKEIEELVNQNAIAKFDENQYKIVLSGSVSDAENKPIPNVVISNLSKGESYFSDPYGKYEINVSDKDILNFSHSGFESQIQKVNNQTTQNIVLKKSNTNFDLNIKIEKTVIYLYPTSKTDINFSCNFKGTLLNTFPKYKTNLPITAYPNGNFFDKKTKRFYSSLFWDGTQSFPDEHFKYKSGFVVSKMNLTSFLIEKLESLGLNNFETNDFIEFWLPILQKNETNFIHFYTNSEYDIFSTNSINPKPQTSIKVFMEFYSLKNKIQIPEQKLSKIKRKGFTVVEWGGADVNEPVNTLKRI